MSLAIPSGQNAVVRGISLAEVGKAAGANSMMRELGGVFGIAVVVAVFAGAGGYASAATFADGFAPAVACALASRSPAPSSQASCRAPRKSKQPIEAEPRARASKELTMTQTVVRYRVKPDRAEENARLVRAVYEELREVKLEGFRYVT